MKPSPQTCKTNRPELVLTSRVANTEAAPSCRLLSTLVKRMNYPPEYSDPSDRLIAVDDLIWFNEGTQVGFVYEIIENPSTWGLDETGVMTQALHPLGVKEKENSPGLCFYPERCFRDEGIGKLTEKEKIELNRAIELALDRFEIHNPTFTVGAYKKENSQKEEWHIRLFQDGDEGRIERIDFTENTRQNWTNQSLLDNA